MVQALSDERVEALRTALFHSGIAADVLAESSDSLGSSDPVDDSVIDVGSGPASDRVGRY